MNGVKSSSAIFFGSPHWCSLRFGTNDDHRTAGVIDALTEQVLTEAALLPLEHVGQRLQRPLVRARERLATAAVVEQGVDRLLQHPLFVADDDLRSVELDSRRLQTIVAVDNAAVEVVEIAGRETLPPIKRHERTQIWRNHRHASVSIIHSGLLSLSRKASDDLQTFR